jgi:hypothetical protein
MNTKPNQVWITNQGRFALIVWSTEGNQMLWRDEVDGLWTVTPIENRLKELTKLSAQEFFMGQFPKMPLSGCTITKLP